MTISHPANVKTGENRVLASGIDSLVLSLNVSWWEISLFKNLDEIKEKAKQFSIDYQGHLKHFEQDKIWSFTIKPHGTKGFSWILIGSDFSYRIANSEAPGSRPNVMIEFRSEALWRLGPDEVINIALRLLEANGAHIIEAKLSRVDLCLDFLLPEENWSMELIKYAVTRATDFAPYFRNKNLTGIRIGKDVISARLYDKPLEIKQQSKKYWMFDIWRIQEVPNGQKIIRIEFQLRREVLKQLGLNTLIDLPKIDNAWVYCTKNWLKFQDRPGLHHTQRSTLKWYEEVQNGFRGAQGAQPLVREKAVAMDKKKLVQQANGLITAIHAINQEENGVKHNTPVDMLDCLKSYASELRKNLPESRIIQERILRKRSKYHREMPATEEAQKIYQLRRPEE